MNASGFFLFPAASANHFKVYFRDTGAQARDPREGTTRQVDDPAANVRAAVIDRDIHGTAIPYIRHLNARATRQTFMSCRHRLGIQAAAAGDGLRFPIS